MKKRAQLLKLLILLLVVFAGGWYLWWKGSPYQDRYYSPNRQYYVQKYRNVSLSAFKMAMPGQGSDMIDGYIRLYDKNGRLLDEHFSTFIRDVEPVWDGRNVYLMGVNEMDDKPWILPTPSS